MLSGTVATKDYSPRATKIESTASAAQGTLKCTVFHLPAGSTGIIQAFLAHPCVARHHADLSALPVASQVGFDSLLDCLRRRSLNVALHSVPLEKQDNCSASIGCCSSLSAQKKHGLLCATWACVSDASTSSKQDTKFDDAARTRHLERGPCALEIHVDRFDNAS